MNILQPVQFGGLLIGAMLPYAFSAFTMKAVGDAAIEMMNFIIKDYEAGDKKREAGEEHTPDYDCLLYTSPSPRDATLSRMPSSA